ncbi:DUF262 domain-containing protein [Corallococcus sp. RDP092CA]|uniref:DUF262 domain-containing protein n=1 Tax=Corallococcus sp. RDP092CA TaxID=3109369 RepID=UPI0035B2A27C
MTEPTNQEAPEGQLPLLPEGVEPPTPGGWDDYPIDELAIRDETRTAVDVVRRIDKGHFVLDPDFQRGFVWDEKKQSRLIESILMRIPLPVFYLAEDAQGRLVVVDGQQRLTTLKRFLNNELPLELEDRKDLHTKRFEQLEPRLQNRVEDCQLRCYIIDHKVPERARLDIFERVNGGEVLTRQQMRNALYNGPATQFLRDEASTELFLDATGRSLDAKKMQDREFVNRFCSFSLLPLDDKEKGYKGDMDDWLARGLRAVEKLPEVDRKHLSEKFRLGLKNNFAVFGKQAFRKHRQADQKRSIINASIFDVMMSELSKRDDATVAAKADALREAFVKRMDDQEFVGAVTYGPNTPKEVRKRFEIAAAMMKEVFDAA